MPSIKGWREFHEFDRRNPQVYAELVKLAREAVKTGRKKIGIKMLWEVLRWHFFLQTSDDTYKLPNNHHSYYARVIMIREEDLEGIFNVRGEPVWEDES